MYYLTFPHFCLMSGRQRANSIRNLVEIALSFLVCVDKKPFCLRVLMSSLGNQSDICHRVFFHVTRDDGKLHKRRLIHIHQNHQLSVIYAVTWAILRPAFIDITTITLYRFKCLVNPTTQSVVTLTTLVWRNCILGCCPYL